MQYKMNLILCQPKTFRPVSFARIWKNNEKVCDLWRPFPFQHICIVLNSVSATINLPWTDAKMKITVLCLSGCKQKIWSNRNYFVRCGGVIWLFVSH